MSNFFTSGLVSAALIATAVIAGKKTTLMVPTDYDDYSIADFQIRGTGDSIHSRLQTNAPPVDTYDFYDYNITHQLKLGIRYTNIILIYLYVSIYVSICVCMCLFIAIFIHF